MFQTSEHSTSRLVFETAGFQYFAFVCAYILYRSDQEATRLLSILKNWRTVEDDAKEFKKIKARLVFGYWLIFALSMIGAAIYGIALLGRV